MHDIVAVLLLGLTIQNRDVSVDDSVYHVWSDIFPLCAQPGSRDRRTKMTSELSGHECSHGKFGIGR